MQCRKCKLSVNSAVAVTPAPCHYCTDPAQCTLYSVTTSPTLHTVLYHYCTLLTVLFSSKTSEHPHAQTIKARDLNFSENVCLPMLVTCQDSCVMCHVSRFYKLMVLVCGGFITNGPTTSVFFLYETILNVYPSKKLLLSKIGKGVVIYFKLELLIHFLYYVKKNLHHCKKNIIIHCLTRAIIFCSKYKRPSL